MWAAQSIRLTFQFGFVSVYNLNEINSTAFALGGVSDASNAELFINKWLCFTHVTNWTGTAKANHVKQRQRRDARKVKGLEEKNESEQRKQIQDLQLWQKHGTWPKGGHSLLLFFFFFLSLSYCKKIMTVRATGDALDFNWEVGISNIQERT